MSSLVHASCYFCVLQQVCKPLIRYGIECRIELKINLIKGPKPLQSKSANGTSTFGMINWWRQTISFSWHWAKRKKWSAVNWLNTASFSLQGHPKVTNEWVIYNMSGDYDVDDSDTGHEDEFSLRLAGVQRVKSKVRFYLISCISELSCQSVNNFDVLSQF